MYCTGSYCFTRFIASFPDLPCFCSSVFVQYNTWKRKSPLPLPRIILNKNWRKKKTGEIWEWGYQRYGVYTIIDAVQSKTWMVVPCPEPFQKNEQVWQHGHTLLCTGALYSACQSDCRVLCMWSNLCTSWCCAVWQSSDVAKGSKSCSWSKWW